MIEYPEKVNELLVYRDGTKLVIGLSQDFYNDRIKFSVSMSEEILPETPERGYGEYRESSISHERYIDAYNMFVNMTNNKPGIIYRLNDVI